jgi:hypothetical protein
LAEADASTIVGCPGYVVVEVPQAVIGHHRSIPGPGAFRAKVTDELQK